MSETIKASDLRPGDKIEDPLMGFTVDSVTLIDSGVRLAVTYAHGPADLIEMAADNEVPVSRPAQ